MINLKDLVDKYEVREKNKSYQYQMSCKGRVLSQQKLYKITQRRKV